MITVNGYPVKITRFPDNTFKFDTDEVENVINEDGKTVFHWRFESMEELFTLKGLIKHFKLKDLKSDLVLYMPYLPNARMDKTHDYYEGFMLEFFGDELNEIGFSKVIVEDVHSTVAYDLINNLEEIPYATASRIFASILASKATVLCFPDKGARDRYTKLLSDVSQFGVTEKIVYGEKIRNQETGKIISYQIVDELGVSDGASVLIVDDICSGGYTFKLAGDALKARGAKELSLYVTHMEDTAIDRGTIFEDGLFKQVFTSKSLVTKSHEKLVKL